MAGDIERACFSPLEGIKNEVLIEFVLFGQNISVTSFTLMLFTVYTAVFVLFMLFSHDLRLVPASGQFVLESFYKFIVDMVVGRAGPSVISFFPMIFTIFVFILFGNLCGIFPFGMTVTAQVSLAVMLGYSSFIGLTYLGFILHKLSFMRKFIVGGGMAFVLVALLFVLEIVSYLVRPLSLSVRLAANMIGGHALLHLLAMMFTKFITGVFGKKVTWSMVNGTLGGVFFVTGVFAVFMLEVGVAFLQAYIFSLLLCLYLGEAVKPI